MGLLSSKASSSMQVNFSHPALSNPSLVCIEGKQYLRVTCSIEEVEYQRWNSVVQTYRGSNSPPSLLLLPIQSSFHNSGICSTTGTAQVFALSKQLLYDKFCRPLSEELYHRNARGTPFTEPQLWQLLLTLVKCEKQLQIFGQALGDVRPQNIFLNQSRKIRVGGRNSWPAGSSAFEKGVQRISAFVSPQDMEALSSGAMKPCGMMTSDIFGIGLTLLSLANLTNYQLIYKMGEKKMDLDVLSEGIVTVKRNKSYSEIIRCIIVNVCSYNPAQRMVLDELWGLLSKHEAKILSKQPFVIDNAPIKLHSQVEKLRTFITDNPMLFASEHLLSEVGGSGLEFPAHLDVHKIKPEYIFSETKTIIEHLQ